MEILQEIINQIDKGIGPEFAASLAGLSLAAAAFFFPNAKVVLDEGKVKLAELNKKIDRAENRGYNYDSELKQERSKIETTLKSIDDAQKGLIKAFLIFTWFLVYTVSIDQIFNIDFVKNILKVENSQAIQFITFSDLVLSGILFAWAGKNLWEGAMGIRNYHKVNFTDEKEQLMKVLEKIERVK